MNFIMLFKRRQNFLTNLLFYLNKRFTCTETSKILDILQTMSYRNQGQEHAKASFDTRKGNLVKYPTNSVQLQVIGSGAPGAPRGVSLYTNNCHYLFNCGEGIQRTTTEYKFKLSRTPNLFITFPTWENLSGLLGVTLTLQTIGIPELNIHGVSCIEDIFSMTNKFVALRHLTVNMKKCDPESDFYDGTLNVKYVHLYPSNMNNLNKNSSDSKLIPSEHSRTLGISEAEISEDSENYFSDEDDIILTKHTSMKNRKKNSKKNSGGKKKRTQSEFHKQRVGNKNVAISFICTTREVNGTLLLNKCIDHGVPFGPLLGKLKAGEDVTLSDGTIVKSSEVKLPNVPGAVIIVLECPTEDYLDSLLREPAFYRHQSCEKNHELASAVVHFSPANIVKNPKYLEWINRFPKATKHLFINENNNCMGSVAVHRLQYKLNSLHPEIFPLLHDGIPFFPRVDPPVHTPVLTTPATDKNLIAGVDDADENIIKDIKYYKCDSSSFIQGKTCCVVNIRPPREYDFYEQIVLKKDAFLNEPLRIEGFEEAFNNFKKEVAKMEESTNSKYPKTVFLGTGSSQANKIRNGSCIVILVDEKKSFILDCAEGSFGQMIRFFGKDKTYEILRNLGFVYVSHLHVDHHMGLTTILMQRKLAFDVVGEECIPLYVLAPIQLTRWLTLYNEIYHPINKLYTLIPNAYFIDTNYALDARKACLNFLDLASLKTTYVHHCPNAFGISIVHKNGWKITYSGDTMPCDNLIKIGMNSDLLIHEATLETAYAAEARRKNHSTTEQAIAVGKKMGAKFTMLTHFSQRYSHIPIFDDNFTDDVGVTFDNMVVSLNQLPILPKMKEVLKIMFTEKYEKLEQRLISRKRRMNSPEARTSKILINSTSTK